MAAFPFRDRGCERVHAWASLELDGELSQLERALLEAHVRKCRSCAAAVEELRALTAALRAAPLERPERELIPHAGRAPARRQRSVALRLAVATMLIAVAAGLGALAGSVGRERQTPARPSGPDIALLPSNDESKQFRGSRPAAGPAAEERPFPPTRLGGV